MNGLVICPGCAGAVPDLDGPTHGYVPAAPGCWELYNRILAREYGEFGYPDVHRLTVDAYMVQHPGNAGSDRRQRQSVAAHLCCLYLVFERDVPLQVAGVALGELVRSRPAWPLLTAPEPPGRLTVLDVNGAANLSEHIERVEDWARSAWEAWSNSHQVIADLVSDFPRRGRFSRLDPDPQPDEPGADGEGGTPSKLDL